MFIIKTTIVATVLAVAAVFTLATFIRATQDATQPPEPVVSEAAQR